MVRLQFTWKGQKIVKYVDSKTILNDIKGIETYTDSFNCNGYFYWFYIDWSIGEVVIGLQGEDIKLTTIENYKLEF